MFMTKSEALSTVARIEALSRGYGFPDDQSKREILHLVETLRSHGPDDGYFREKLFNIKKWSEDGFSAKTFQKYQGGASQLTVFTLGECNTVRNLIEGHWPKNERGSDA
jgi:hypothetical protein